MRSLAVLSSSALLIVANVVPAVAADAWRLYRHQDAHWHEVHRGIYESKNRIALLQADPDQKGPVITAARAKIRQMNAQLPPPGWRWDVPCCYRRKPIHLR